MVKACAISSHLPHIIQRHREQIDCGLLWLRTCIPQLTLCEEFSGYTPELRHLKMKLSNTIGLAAVSGVNHFSCLMQNRWDAPCSGLNGSDLTPESWT